MSSSSYTPVDSFGVAENVDLNANELGIMIDSPKSKNGQKANQSQSHSILNDSQDEYNNHNKQEDSTINKSQPNETLEYIRPFNKINPKDGVKNSQPNMKMPFMKITDPNLIRSTLSCDNSLPSDHDATNELPRKRKRKSQNQLLLESMKDHFANGLSAHNASNRILENSTRFKDALKNQGKAESCIERIAPSQLLQNCIQRIKEQPEVKQVHDQQSKNVNNTAKLTVANIDKNPIPNGNAVVPLFSSLTKNNLLFNFNFLDHSYAKAISEKSDESGAEEFTGSNLSKVKFSVDTKSSSSPIKNHIVPTIKIALADNSSRNPSNDSQSSPSHFQSILPNSTSLHLKLSSNSQPSPSPVQNILPNLTSLHLPSTSRAWRHPPQSPVQTVSNVPKTIGCSFYYKGIMVQKQTDIVVIQFRESNRAHNFLPVEALIELQKTLNEATDDPQCKLVVFRGSTHSFCSGLDLRLLLLENREQIALDFADNIGKLAKTLHEFSKPIIACVTGPAINFGVTLLCYCDQVICSELATFQMLTTSLGYLAEGGATLMLPSIVGTLVASSMLFQGRKITALQGLSHKLVSYVAPYEHVYAQTMAHANKMLKFCTQTQRLTKMMLRNSQTSALKECLNYEKTMLPQHWLSDNTQREIQNTYDHGGALSENSP